MATYHADVKSQRTMVFQNSSSSIADLLWATDSRPSIHDPSTGKSLNHQSLFQFVRDFRLQIPPHVSSKPVVAVILPNGPLLAVTVFAVANRYTAAPINASSGADQIRADVLQAGAHVVLVSPHDIQKLGLNDSWIADAGINVVPVELGDDLSVRFTDQETPNSLLRGSHTPNAGSDCAILLFTSGTSGKKKLVPLTIQSILTGVSFVIESWGLTSADVCNNLMPLNHVGGLVRNLFAPVMSGGSTICCKAFDPNLFWDVVEDFQPTWYYASPTMHSMILEEASNRSAALSKSRIRLVCNAAGGLLPSLACQLRDTFHCVVLPSYGMTECMPISSPPLDYQLNRPGTSGISVGPQLAIFNGNDVRCEPGTVGRIMVRGEPVFPGYLRPDGSIDTTCFTKDGWFDTGDMGYMDEDGYLYVTGRNKEVINRGGELISPFEIEEAIVTAAQKPESPIFGRVSQALAFSVTHDVLQEVVGVVLVTPEGSPRTDIRALQEAVSSSLQQVKWPVVLVFMDNVPKRNNKVLRIKLGERLGLEQITDDLLMAHRHFEATCPPPDTALTVPIECAACTVDLLSLSEIMESSVPQGVMIHVRSDSNTGFPEIVLAPKNAKSFVNMPANFAEQLLAELRSRLPGYHNPSKAHCLETTLPLDRDGCVDDVALDKLLIGSSHDAQPDQSMSETEQKIARVFADVLSCSVGELSATSDFFNLGGDSLKAGRLLSLLRKEYQVRLPIDVLFTHSQLDTLAQVVDQKLSETAPSTHSGDTQAPLPGCTKTYSSTNPFLLLLQLLPLMFVYPGKRALTWTIFVYTLTATQVWVTTVSVPGRLVNLVFSLAVARLITRAVAPLLAIAFKWVLIGRYKEGIYPMWGWYHTRWWLVQKILAVGGMGHFSFSNSTRVLYYRLLGAKIGKGVSLAKGLTLGEYDLLEIGDYVTLDKCICRPFAAERNTSMYLGRIVLGRNSSVGQSSIVAAGTVLPENVCIGPNSSSWEMKDATESNRDLSASKIPGGPWTLNAFVTMPVMIFVRFIGALPWMLGLIGLVLTKPNKSQDQLASVLFWFAAPHRIAFHYLALIMNTAFGPIFLFVVAWVLKKIVDLAIGKSQPGPAGSRSQLQRFRMSFLKAILPGAAFHKLTDLFGTHYGFTSFAVRALGGKVGDRVYWPGTGPSVQEFDLLDVGNDVVFGSRSHLVTSDGLGSDHIRIGDGAMVSDRVVLLPGSSLGKGTVMGSGALSRRGKHYPASTTWVGSKGGEAICLSGASRHENPGHISLSDLEKALLSQMTTPVNSQLQSRVASTAEFSSLRAPTITEVGTPMESVAASVVDLSKTEKGVHQVAEVTVKEAKTTKPEPTSSTPFGRAFYEGKAPYYVLGQFPIFLYSALTTVLTAFYWNVATTSSVQLVAKLVKLNKSVLVHNRWRPLTVYAFFLFFITVLMTIQALGALGIVIGAKWGLMGRRKAGSYDWDKSSYNQRWQIFLAVEKLRRHCYGGHGILGMLTGTHYAVMYFRALGATIGKDCALFAGGLPSLMFTEPDLLTLGDRVAVDDASLVAHINTRGHFNLNPLSVGDRSVLRSGSRLLSGARMESDSCLLEHTLVMAGDVADSGSTYQGWPADAFWGLRAPVETSV